MAIQEVTLACGSQIKIHRGGVSGWAQYDSLKRELSLHGIADFNVVQSKTPLVISLGAMHSKLETNGATFSVKADRKFELGEISVSEGFVTLTDTETGFSQVLQRGSLIILTRTVSGVDRSPVISLSPRNK